MISLIGGPPRCGKTTVAKQLAERLCCSALYGTAGDLGGAAELSSLRQIARASQRVDTQLIAGADHVYSGCEEALARVIADWIMPLC